MTNTAIQNINRPTVGGDTSSWGTELNTAIEQLEEGYAKVSTVSHNDSTEVTLTRDQSRAGTIKITGAITQDRLVRIPNYQHTFMIHNATTGGHDLTFRAGTSGTSVKLPSGHRDFIYCDGSGNLYEANFISSLRITNGAIYGNSDNFVIAADNDLLLQASGHHYIFANHNPTTTTDSTLTFNSPGDLTNVAGGHIAVTSAEYISFVNGSQESMRIKSDGDIYIGSDSGKGIRFNDINDSRREPTFRIRGTNNYDAISISPVDQPNNTPITIFKSGDASHSNFIDCYASRDGSIASWIGGIRSTSNGMGLEFNNSSDRRDKHDIRDFTTGLEVIEKLQPRKFKWNFHSEGKDDMGFIAQELQEVLPDLVHTTRGDQRFTDTDKDNGSRLTISKIDPIVPFLINAVKELSERVKELENGRTV